jgi:hypothetical protein
MLILSKISKMNFRQLWVLIKVLFTRPLFIIPTYKGTQETIRICNRRYGKAHHRDTRANAFRHALWNFLICEKCSKVSKSTEKAIFWSEKVTNLHELLSPNRDIARKMDLHNNFVGRHLYLENSNTDILKKLQEMLKEAIKVSSPEDVEKAGNKLVFIED